MSSQDKSQEVLVASVTLAKVLLAPDAYTIDPTNQVAIWFSNNPQIALPQTQKEKLAARARNNPHGTTMLVYDASLLDLSAQKDLLTYAGQNHITLRDISGIDSQNPLFKLARLELEKMRAGAGGNPASASDLIRWVPEVMGDTCIYADIDLDTNGQTPAGVKTLGLPVALHMGSIIRTEQHSGRRHEATVVNTDIIGFAGPSAAKTLFIDTVANEMIKAYENPFAALEEEKSTLCEIAGFQQLEAQKADLFALRKATIDCTKNLETFCKFIGPELLQEKFVLTKKEIGDIYSILDSNALDKDKAIANILTPKINRPLQERMRLIQQELFKPLVMEISGPGAVHRALGANDLNNVYRNTDQPTIVSRALQQYGCINNVSTFVSDNIPPWRTSEEDHDQAVYNRNGLSWVPSMQKQLATAEPDSLAIDLLLHRDEQSIHRTALLVEDPKDFAKNTSWEAIISHMPPSWIRQSRENQAINSLENVSSDTSFTLLQK